MQPNMKDTDNEEGVKYCITALWNLDYTSQYNIEQTDTIPKKLRPWRKINPQSNQE